MSDPIINGVPHVLAADAAKEAGLPGHFITRCARRGLIRGRKIGSQWFIEREAIQRLFKSRS